MNEKYILQYGSLAGWPFKIAKELRNMGYNSLNVMLYDRDVIDLKRDLPYDKVLCKRSDFSAKIGAAILKYIWKVPKEVSLIHYHSGTIFFRELHKYLEGPFFKHYNIPMLLSMGGNDFRQIWKARENNPHFFRENNPAWDKRIDKKLRSMAKNIKYCATDPEMLEHAEPYFEKVFLFRQPVDFTYQDFRYPDPEEKKPVILHIPTNPWVKGTNYLLKAIEKLEQEKIPFTFKYIRNLTQKEMANALLEADIYVDELLIGGHGVTAVESLAAGKPTITYIREDLLKKYPEDMPIISANPDTIYKELKRLILEPKQRYQIGVASREYAKKYHDIRVVCNDLLKIYKEIGFR